jgi:hypothetical protein
MVFLALGLTNFVSTFSFKIFLKLRKKIKNSTDHNFLGPLVNKLCTHFQKVFIKNFEFSFVKPPTNHYLFGPWANKFQAHLQKIYNKFFEKKSLPI